MAIALCYLLPTVAIAADATQQSRPILSVEEIRPRRVEPASSQRLDEKFDLVYARYGERALKLDLFRPKQLSQPLPAVVIVHGGGWKSGDKTRFRGLAQRLAERGYVTVAIEYRLADEAKFPAAIHDCNTAVRWLRAKATQYGIDSTRIAAVGGSAGGHLVGLMASAPHLEELQGSGGNSEQSSQLQAAVVMAGPFELATGPIAERSRQQPQESNTNLWLGKTIEEAPALYRLASPLSHLSSRMPPVLFMHGEFDKPEQNRTARMRLRELGVETELTVYKFGRHGCWNQHPWFKPMLDDIDTFLAATLRHNLPEYPRRQFSTDAGNLTLFDNRVELATRGDIKQPIMIPRLNNPIMAVTVGDDGKTPLTLRPEPDVWKIVWPEGKQPLSNSRVVIETVGTPCLGRLPRIISADAEGEVTLAAHDAVTHGKLLRYEPQPHKNTLGYWTNEKDWCEWHFYVETPGNYRLHVLQGCGDGQAGSEVEAKVGDQEVLFQVEETGHFQNFKDREIGKIALDEGLHTFQLRPRSKAAKAVMDVRQVRLTPE